MAKYKNGTPWDENFFSGDPYSHQIYGAKYYDNLDYFHHTTPKYAHRYPAVGRQGYDVSSSDLDPRDRKPSSSVGKSRIAITVAVVLTTSAIFAAIVVAVYVTSIPDKRNESLAIIRKVEVNRLKTYQGEVGLANEWNENLTDPASPVYKQEVNNFISAMDQIYGNSPDNDRYNGTVVDGFRSGSTIVKCRMFWIGIYIQEIDTSEKSNDGQEGQVISEVEINPVESANLINRIKDALPNLLGTSLTATPEFQVVATAIATPTTVKPSTAAPTTEKPTTAAPTTAKPTTTTQEPLTNTTKPVTTTTMATKKTTTTMTTTPTIFMPTSTTAATTPKPSTTTTTTTTSTSTTTTSTTTTKPTKTPQPTTILTTPIPTTTSTTSTPTTSSTTTTSKSTTSATTSTPTTTSTTTTPKSTTSTTTTPKPTLSTPTSTPTTTTTPKSTTSTTTTPKSATTSTTTTPKPATTSTTTAPKSTTSTTTLTLSTTISTTTPKSTTSITTTPKATLSTTTSTPTITSITTTPKSTTSTTITPKPATTSTPTTPKPAATSTTTTPKPATTSTTTTPKSTTSTTTSTPTTTSTTTTPKSTTSITTTPKQTLSTTTSTPTTTSTTTIQESTTSTITTPKPARTSITTTPKPATTSTTTTPKPVTTSTTTTPKSTTSTTTSTPTTTSTTTTPKSTTSITTTPKLATTSTTTTPKPATTSSTTTPKPATISTTTTQKPTITSTVTTPKPTTTMRPALTTSPNSCEVFDLEVRLSHQMYHYGRVEIRCRNSSDEWGTICDDMWDELDAKVICRHLGYPAGTEAYSYRGAYFGQGSGPTMINGVDCQGDERYLSNCTSQQLGNIHCTHVQDAGVSCGKYISTTPGQSTSSTRVSTTSTLPNYTTTATPRISESFAVRIVDGPSCIEGRVEILYLGQWGTVCYSAWDDFDAIVLCNMLGYGTFGVSAYGGNEIFNDQLYGPSSGPVVLDNVACIGWESSIAECSHGGWGPKNCSRLITAGVKCGGNERQCMVQLAVDCDFDIDRCGYTTVAVSGRSLWKMGYIDIIPIVPSIASQNANTDDNKVAYYLNRGGSEIDEAYLLSPSFTINASTMILEFYYWINSSTAGALSLEGEGMELWESQVLRSEEEGKWMYQCASLGQLMPGIEQTVSFYAKRGPNSFRIVAVDNIKLNEGTCKYGLEDAMCDFEHPSIHGYTIDCTSCRLQIPMFRWYWGYGSTQSDGTGPSMDHTYGTVRGYYMYVESSYGKEGNATALTFPTISTETTFKAVQFYYHMYGRHVGALRVMLEYNGQKEVVWEKSGNEGNLWKKACTLLPENSNVTISFVAVRGPGPYGDIAVDDIELIKENCQHPINCMDDFQKCEYTRSSQSEDFMWNWNGDLHGTFLQCNFEADDCGYNSSPWQHVESSRITQLGNIIHDPVYGERVGMHATTEGQVAVLRSPAFKHTGKAQYLMFYHQIPTTDTIKTKFLNHHDGTETLLSSKSSNTDDLELVCINLPRITADSSISFESIRGDNSIKYSKPTSIRSVEIKYGHCPDTLDVHNCTFEQEHVLCSHNITTSVTPSCDQPVYMWMRHSRATWTNRTGPDFDHTFTMKEMNRNFTYANMTGEGHYMYVDASVGSPGDTTTLALKDFLFGKFCSLRFFYHIYGNSTPVLRVRETMRHIYMVLPSFDLKAWIPGCIELKNDCTVEDSTIRSVSFVAERGDGPYGDIAIDDISLSLQKCPDTSTNCTFTDGMCGYAAEYGWELNQTADGGYLVARGGERGKLISPSVKGPGCVILYYTSTIEDMFDLIFSMNLIIGDRVYPIMMDGQTRMITVPVNTARPDNLVMTLSSGFPSAVFSLHNVTFSSECPVLECPKSDFACEHNCIIKADVCDGHIMHCRDGRDEADHRCSPAIECDFNQLYACNYTFTNANFTITDFSIITGILDGAVHLNSVLSFIESPKGVFDSESCLQYKYTQNGEGRHRLVSNTSAFLKNLYIFDGLKAQDIPVTLHASLPRGNYSIIFEFQTNSLTGSYARVDDVEILNGSCRNYSVSCNLEEFLCLNTMWNGDALDICLPNMSKCNGNVDCSDGSDEMSCPETTTPLAQTTPSTTPGNTTTAAAIPTTARPDNTTTTEIMPTTNVSKDGCHPNPVSVCLLYDFQHVIMPNIMGQTSVTEAGNQLNFLFNEFHSWLPYIRPVKECINPLITLFCGLHMSDCIMGEHNSLCRESCEVIARSCVKKSAYSSWVAINMEYFCRFLPYQVDNPTCLPISTSDLEPTSTVPDGGSRPMIESVRLMNGNSEYSGRLEVLVNGTWGTVCDSSYSLDFLSAATCCFELGFSFNGRWVHDSYYGFGTRTHINNINCSAGQRDLDNCTIQFDSYCQNSYERNMGLICFPANPTCNFHESVCEYYGDKWYRTFDEENVGYIMTYAQEGELSELMSPRFTSKSSSSITFTYKIGKWTSGKYMFSVDDGRNRTALWQLDARKHEGIFRDCVDLQGFNGVKVQLVFSVEISQPLNTAKLTAQGIFDITYNSGSCPGVFPSVVCTFESITACPFVATCNEQDSYTFQIRSGPSDSYFTGPQTDYTTQNEIGHYMIADASYGQEGDSANFKISVKVQPDQYYLWYRYHTSGPHVGNLRVHIIDKDRASSILVDEHYGDQGASWNRACSTVSRNGLNRYDIVFTATRGNGTQGDIAVDDIELNHKPCPYSVSCDFESPTYCDYNISQTAYHWEEDYVWQLNGILLASGNYMRTNPYNSSEGDVAEMRSPSFSLSVDTKCVSFAFIMSGESVGSLSVYVVYNNDAAQRKRGFYAAGNKGFKWYEASVILEYANSTYQTAAIVFSAQRGDHTNSIIGLDSILISSEKCIYGIQNEICDFNHPYLCGIQSNCTEGSRYQWHIYHGASLTNGTGASWDADHDYEGSYLTIDSSYGKLGHVSYAWFPTAHTSAKTKLIFDYHMYGKNEDFKNLTVLYETHSGLETLEQLCCNRGNRWIFQCLQLPANTQGAVYFKATRKDGIFGDISLDNVGLIEEDCPTQSVTCDFNGGDFNCGYRGWERTNKNKNYFMVSTDPLGTTILLSPFAVYEGPACVAFDYKISVDQNNMRRYGFMVRLSFDMSSGEHSEKVFSMTEDTGDDWQSRQIQIPEQNNETGFWIEFVAYGRGYFAVDNVMLKPGECSLSTCAADRFACIEKCIPIEMECDKKMDCENGRDEKVSCTSSIACDFEMGYHCGYQNTSYDSFNAGWAWINNQTLEMWNTTGNIVDERNKNGYFLVAILYTDHDVIRVESPAENLAEEKCLRFSYFGNGELNVEIDMIGGLEWSIVENVEPFIWKPGQVNIPVGNAVVRFELRAPWSQSGSFHLISGVDNIQLLDGPCVNNKINCSGVLLPCSDNSRCIHSSQICNKIRDCHDGSDESEETCPGSLACQFEDALHCGYKNLQENALWDQRSGNFFKQPRYDHTCGNDTGQFMVAHNNSDLEVYYNEISYSGLLFPHRLEYLNAILSSPRESFMTESCVYFYYYLNGTAVRPNPLSAQLFVYVNGSRGKRLAWYDHVNRTVNGWLKGWVPLQPGFANIIFEAKTVTATTVWPGVVALDDVSVISGPCPAYPGCGPDTFRCTTNRVCIPVYMQCDGGNDCIDGSDEENCISKPDYQVKLINGDGSYGSIAIFYQGLWRPVCMSKYSLMEGNSTTVRLACKKVGYTGRYQGAFINSWHQPVQYAMEVSCKYNDVDISSCSMQLNQTTESTISCYYYQAAFCSNENCFSGERLCPPNNTDINHSFSTKCISHIYFCDGIPDCPGRTDELNCANCSTSEFECTNHECVPASQQCDGTPQCGDKSDEYGCVSVANNMSQIYHSQLSTYLPVCNNSMNSILANMLCSLSGQGSSTHYQSYTYGQGTMLTPQSDAATSLVPGYAVSIAACYSVLIQCASIECGTTVFDDSRLPKILHGRDAVLGQLPWQIALYENGVFICSGSIIHPNWVITASHCTVDLRLYSVKVGAVKVGRRSSGDYQGHFYNSSRRHTHPFYNSDATNDISLLYFSQPIVFNNYVRPICIASERTVEEMLHAGYNAECYVSGWGHYQDFINREKWLGILQMVRVHLYNKEECDRIYNNFFGSYPQNITVCVDNQKFGSPTCHGDSGGALICRNKYGRFEVLGTLSWGYGSCFKDGYPDIYQLSYPHASWIEQITGLDFSDLTMDMD